MSTQAKSQAKKRGRPTARTIKVRQNITIDPGTLKKARKMAFDDGLALSTWIEQMIRERISKSSATA